MLRRELGIQWNVTRLLNWSFGRKNNRTFQEVSSKIATEFRGEG
jgi:hypothetical protein